MDVISTYLLTAHFEFAHDFDRHLAIVSLTILGTVNITEGTVAHLLNQLPALQARIVRKFALFCILLSDDFRDTVGRDFLLLQRLSRLSRSSTRRTMMMLVLFGARQVIVGGTGLLACSDQNSVSTTSVATRR
jgi:hypothetical protein